MASVLVATSNALSRRRRLSSSFSELRGPYLSATEPTKAAAAGEFDGGLGGQENRLPEVDRRLSLWSELPFWQQHGSELIHSRYRRASGSVKECLESWFYLHNESVNIHSHVFGAVVFSLLPLYVFNTEIPPRYAVATKADVVVCSAYFLGVAVCFVLSTVFHTFMSHSETAYRFGMKLDIQGVLVLMWSSTIPLIYYNFTPDLISSSSCTPSRSSAPFVPRPQQDRTDESLLIRLRATYFLATTVLAVACSIATFTPVLSGPHMGVYRAALFGSFGGGSFLVPVAHGIILRGGIGEHGPRIGLWWVVLTAVCNGVGFVVYTLKFPERWFPRRFDLFGASHQIMHILVVAAAMSYAVAVVKSFDVRHVGDLC